jgi:hypothetical protein
MGNMMDLGQAAGTAAGLCIKNKVSPHKIDVKTVQEALIGSGVEIFPEKEKK